ncbi:MAG: tRNA 2-thiouridine(34) synthase MnmA [Thermoleophilia bacterium]|nr:tRNA 2-thiouridine(34) synthase MnmA [Thermoleophilia bacterium]
MHRSLSDHLRDPALGDGWQVGVGAQAAEGCAGGSCGVVARFLLEVDADGTIRSCSSRVRGRASAFATASALCEAARGLGLVDAARLGLGTLHPSFAEMDDEDRERALVVEDGFHHALGRWCLARMREAPAGFGADRPDIAPAIGDPAGRVRALVGMSGGVDSAVALHRIAQEEGAGATVAGVTLRLWIDPRAPDPEAACCSPDSVRRARATCHRAGLPHLSIDLRDAFARDVVVPFVEEYAKGETPNPCVRCNGDFRLDELVRLADVLGADRVATGHYARIVRRDGVALLARGVDEGKDQSYMLAQVAPATLERLAFPLGFDRKPQVRAEAAQLGLEQADTPESQEVCFLGGGDYRDFLARAGALGTPGEIVLDAGDGTAPRVVGSHTGVARFTPGQRKGIGVAAASPLYVHDVDPASGRVLVGPASPALERTRVSLGDVRWHHPDPPADLRVQLRYRSRGGATPVRVHDGTEPGTATLELAQTQRAPAPGQVAVLYDRDDVVVGTGRILRDPVVAVAHPGS